MKHVKPEGKVECAVMIDNLEERIKRDRMISQLESVQTTGGISSVTSLIATAGFLLDQWSKINSKDEDGNPDKLNDNLFFGRQVTPDDLMIIWWAAVLLALFEALATASLVYLTQNQIKRARNSRSSKDRMLPDILFKYLKFIIVLFDYVVELIIVSLSFWMFYHTEFETLGGFILSVSSTFLDWYLSWLELKQLENLRAYTRTAIMRKADRIRTLLG